MPALWPGEGPRTLIALMPRMAGQQATGPHKVQPIHTAACLPRNSREYHVFFVLFYAIFMKFTFY